MKQIHLHHLSAVLGSDLRNCDCFHDLTPQHMPVKLISTAHPKVTTCRNHGGHDRWIRHGYIPSVNFSYLVQVCNDAKVGNMEHSALTISLHLQGVQHLFPKSP